MGSGGWFEGKFSVSFGPKPGFKLWIGTWTKLNNWKGGGGLYFSQIFCIALFHVLGHSEVKFDFILNIS